jgi:hypothetical protein
MRMDIRAEVAAWRERSKITFDRSDSAPAVQKFEPMPSPLREALRLRGATPTGEPAKADQTKNGIWINPDSFKLLITGQEMMTMTRGEVRALVAARRDGSAPPPKLELSPQGQRFTAAAIEVRERIRAILSADGKDPGPGLNLGMFAGTPRIQADSSGEWTDAPTDEIGKMIVDLWKSQGAPAVQRG